MNKCDSYDNGYCRGTKRIEACSCEGHEERCNFYVSVRERGRKALEEEKEMANWHYCPYCGRELK